MERDVHLLPARSTYNVMESSIDAGLRLAAIEANMSVNVAAENLGLNGCIFPSREAG